MRVIFFFIGNNFSAIVYDRLKNVYGASLEIIGFSGSRKLNFCLDDRKLTYIRPEQIMLKRYDMLLVVGARAKFGVLLQNLRYLGIKVPVEKIVLDRTFMIPGFSLERYNEIRKRHVTILSLTCWGGLLSNRLGLEFNSPTVNMFFRKKIF